MMSFYDFMKCYQLGFILSIFLLSVSVQGQPPTQADREVRIHGSPHDGSRTKAPRPPAPKFTIKWETRIHDGDRQIKMRQVRPPIFSKEISSKKGPLARLTPEALATLETKRSEFGAIHFLIISATVYEDEGVTRLQIWNQDKDGDKKQRRTPVEAWSNLNWNHLGGFSSFQGSGKEFHFLMMPANASLENLRAAHKRNPAVLVPQLPAGLPPLVTNGPRYLITRDAVGIPTVRDFLETIHELYRAESETLVQAFQGRELQKKIRARERLAKPAKQEEIEVSSWDNSINKK